MTTTEEKPKLTVESLKVFARDETTKSCVRAYLLAKTFAEVERERVDTYIKPLFELYNFCVSKEHRRSGDPDERITDVDRLWLTDLDSPQYLEFMAECAKEHRKHGWTGPADHCPALVADCVRIDAENLLIEHTSKSLPLGFEDIHIYGEHRKKLLDLVIGMTLAESPDEFTADKLLNPGRRRT